MNLPDSKTLKKLADSCRKAGIKQFKSGDLEFTLSDDAPVSSYKKAQKSNTLRPETKIDAISSDFQSDELSPDALLFWSTGGEKVEEDESSIPQ